MEPSEYAYDGMVRLYESGKLAFKAPVAILRPTPHRFLHQLSSPLLFQSFKPFYDALKKEGFEVFSEWERLQEHPIQSIIVMVTKHKEETWCNIAKAYALLPMEGVLIVAAANELGGASYAKKLKSLSPLAQTHSLSKSKITLLRKNTPELLTASCEPHRVGKSDYYAQAGTFSHKKIDVGSRVLIEVLSELPTLKRCADLGAGWGYLGCALRDMDKMPNHLDLYEAEALALTCAKRNFQGDVRVGYHWSDLTTKTPTEHYDTVITNPPFHTEKRGDMGLGVQFITCASALLVPKGLLYLVANKHLPYEAALKEQFEIEACYEKEGFKVFKARKR